MPLKAGIVGLPNVGKSTLFNALANAQVEAANYPFATIKPNVGVVSLPDQRLDRLAAIAKPAKVTHSTVEFIDIAGLVKGAAQGEGLGNKFLANIREVDALVEVVRCFEDDNVIHVHNQINPLVDIMTINTELLLADLEIITGIMKRTSRQAQGDAKQKLEIEHAIAAQAKQHLEAEKPLRSLALSDDELKIVKSWNLLTMKPIIYVGNVSEDVVASPCTSKHFQNLNAYASANHAQAIAVATKIEVELAQIKTGPEKAALLKDLGLETSGLAKLIRATFSTLGLATFFTAGPKEVRSWTFKKNAFASQCAGLIHSDFERGFIRAAVTSYDDYVSLGGEMAAKQAGKTRLEGRDYVVQDGDIIEFKFNV